MSYGDGLLAADERVVRRARQHGLVLIWRARWAILALVIGTLLLWLRANVSGETPILDALGYVTLALFLFGVAVIGWGVFRYRSEEYLVTNRRLIHAQGVVNKRATDASLETISDAVLTESVFGRLLGFGTLEVLTASESGIERLHMLRDARSFKKAMIEAKHELKLDLARPTSPPLRPTAPAVAIAMPPAPPVPNPSPSEPPPPPGSPRHGDPTPDRPSTPGDVVAEIERLAARHAAGEITTPVFDAARRDLLDRL